MRRSRYLPIGLGALALTLCSMQACVGDEPTGSDSALDASTSGSSSSGAPSGSTSSSGDSGPPVLEPDAAPPAGCPLGCLPPAPPSWTGPSAVYDDAVANKPTACPELYSQKELELTRGATAPAPTCSCAPGTPSGFTCSAGWEGHKTSACSDATPYFEGETSACSDIERSSGVSYLKLLLTANTSAGVCTFTEPTKDAAAPAFTTATVACGLPQVATCESRPDCAATPTPGAVYTRLCIHKPGDVSCPSADYAKRFVSYHGVEDTRTCSSCTGPAPTGRCAASLSGTAGCATGTNVPDGACAAYQAYGQAVPVYDACNGTTTPSGGVVDAEPETFCCNK